MLPRILCVFSVQELCLWQTVFSLSPKTLYQTSGLPQLSCKEENEDDKILRITTLFFRRSFFSSFFLHSFIRAEMSFSVGFVLGGTNFTGCAEVLSTIKNGSAANSSSSSPEACGSKKGYLIMQKSKWYHVEVFPLFPSAESLATEKI